MKIKNIGIIAKSLGDNVAGTVNTLYNYLSENAYNVLLDKSAEALISDHPADALVDRETLALNSDLAIVVGGDGTFLSAVRSLADYQIPVMGINLGRLGFLVDISPSEMLEKLEQILNNQYVDECRSLLTSQVTRNGEVICEADAFNDVVVHIRDVARMIEFDTFINGQFVNFQRSDGLVVSTPTGSTAYALSSGGPLLHATLEAMVLVPICPHTLTNRPLVVNADSNIEIVIGESRQMTAQVSFDGQMAFEVQWGDRILIKQKPQKIHLIHPASYDYYEILRAKLRWSEQL